MRQNFYAYQCCEYFAALFERWKKHIYCHSFYQAGCEIKKLAVERDEHRKTKTTTMTIHSIQKSHQICGKLELFVGDGTRIFCFCIFRRILRYEMKAYNGKRCFTYWSNFAAKNLVRLNFNYFYVCLQKFAKITRNLQRIVQTLKFENSSWFQYWLQNVEQWPGTLFMVCFPKALLRFFTKLYRIFAYMIET